MDKQPTKTLIGKDNYLFLHLWTFKTPILNS